MCTCLVSSLSNDVGVLKIKCIKKNYEDITSKLEENIVVEEVKIYK